MDDEEHSMAHELLKIATCVIVENPDELLAKLPSDIQVAYTIYNLIYLYICISCIKFF